jgi:hypothetical protein
MKTAVVIGLFALVVVGFFADVLLGPRILLDANPCHYEPWAAHADELLLAGKTYRTDSFLTYLPRRYELTRAVRSGRFPLWNPYLFGGIPFFADPQTRVIYPVSVLLAAVDPTRALGYDVAIHMLVAMIGMYLFLRAVKAGQAGAMLGAFAYAFSSFFYNRMGHPTFVSTAAWIPFFFYGFERARRSEWPGTLMLTIFLVLGYLAGFPQVFVVGVGALLIYAAFVSLDSNGQSLRRRYAATARIILAAGLLAALVVSVQLVPFIELMRNSTGLHIDYDQMRSVYLTPPVLLIRTLFPDFFGNPVEGTDWSALTRDQLHVYNPEFTVYCGLGALLAALGAIVLIRRSRRIQALTLLLGVSVALAVSSHMLKIAYHLFPVFRASRVSRLSVLGCFAVAGLAGIGLSRLGGRMEHAARRRFVGVVVGIVIVLSIAAVLFVLVGDSLIARLVDKAGSLPEEHWLKTHAHTRLVRVRQWARTSGEEWLSYEKHQVGRSVLFAVLAAGLLLLHAASKPRRLGAVMGMLLVLVVALDVMLQARGYYVSQPRDCLFETPGIEVLKQGLGEAGRWRVCSLSYKHEDMKALPPNTNQLYDIPSLTGTSTIVPRGYGKLVEAITDIRTPQRLKDLDTPLRPHSIVLSDIACVRYVIISGSRSPHVVSPILRAVASGSSTFEDLRVLELGGDRRVAITHSPNVAMVVETEIPEASALDLAVGFTSDARAPGDSVRFWLELEGKGGRLEFDRLFDLYNDRDRWHPFRLDIGTASGGPVGLRVAHVIPSSDQEHLLSAGWSGFELVTGRCTVRRSEAGYSIQVSGEPNVLSLNLASPARELPLEVKVGGRGTEYRWLDFAEPSLRRLLVDMRGMAACEVTVTSDSAFSITECKNVHLRRAFHEYDLVHDQDLEVYENTAAIEKGVCIAKQAVAWERSDGLRQLDFSSALDLTRQRRGHADILSYGPEEISLRVSAERDCYFLFQDVDYPGWKVWVDGERSEFVANDLGLRTIELARGDHQVIMKFEPLSVRLGLGLTLLGIALAVVYSLRLRSRRASGRGLSGARQSIDRV